MTPAVPPVVDCAQGHLCQPPAEARLPRDTAMMPCHAGSDRRSTKAGRDPCRGQLASVGALEFGQSSGSEQAVPVRGQSAPGLSPIPTYEASRHCLSSLERHRALHRGPSQPVSRADIGHHLNSTQRRESSAEKHARLLSKPPKPTPTAAAFQKGKLPEQ